MSQHDTLTPEQLDQHLDAILKAAGSALRHYTMQKSRDDMRAALRAALSATQPAQAAQSETCPTCGESEPYSGACGTSASDMRALCKRKAQAAQGAGEASLIAPDAVWLIQYDDADRRPEILTSEQAARAYFKRISDQWNAHLFVKVESNSRDDRFYSRNVALTQPAAAAQGAGEVATVAEVHMSRYTIEWANGPLPVGTKLYTHPTPAQPAPVVPDEAVMLVGDELARKHAVYLNVSSVRDLLSRALAATPTPPAQAAQQGEKA